MKKIKTIALYICLVCSFSMQARPAYAQTAGRAPEPAQLLRQMRQALDALGTAEFGFAFSAKDVSGRELGQESGTFVAQGERFRLSGSVITVYCDGVTKWVYDMSNQEITIFPHDTSSTDPAENPFAVLGKADPADYTFKGAVRKVNTADGTPAWKISMASKDRNAAYTLIEFTVSRQTMLPVAVSYESRNGDVYELTVASARSVGRLADTEFAPPADLLEDPDVYVTDMR